MEVYAILIYDRWEYFQHIEDIYHSESDADEAAKEYNEDKKRKIDKSVAQVQKTILH